MCFRGGAWLSDASRDISTSSQAPVTVTASPQTRQLVDADNNIDSSPGNKWAAATSTAGDVISTPSTSSVAVSELVDKGVLYLRDRIFNRDSGNNRRHSTYTVPSAGLAGAVLCYGLG